MDFFKNLPGIQHYPMKHFFFSKYSYYKLINSEWVGECLAIFLPFRIFHSFLLPRHRSPHTYNDHTLFLL